MQDNQGTIETHHESLNKDQELERIYIQKELQTLNDQMKTLKRRHAFGEIDKTLYEEFSAEQVEKINLASERFEKLQGKISNLEKYINIFVDVVRNFSKY